MDVQEPVVGQLVQVELGDMTCGTDARGGLITTHGLRLGDDVPVQRTANGLAKHRDLLEACIEVVLVHPASDREPGPPAGAEF
jgi:hypothetical protein